MRKSVRCQVLWPLGHQRERTSKVIKPGRKAASAATPKRLSHGEERICWLPGGGGGAEDGRDRFSRGFLSWDPHTTSHRLTLPGFRRVDQKLRNYWRPAPCPSTNKVGLNRGTNRHPTV